MKKLVQKLRDFLQRREADASIRSHYFVDRVVADGDQVIGTRRTTRSTTCPRVPRKVVELLFLLLP